MVKDPEHVDSKQKSKPTAAKAPPVSAPELTEEQKQHLEEEFQVTHAVSSAPEDDADSHDDPNDELEAAWTRPDVVVGGVDSTANGKKTAKPATATWTPPDEASMSPVHNNWSNSFKRFFAAYRRRMLWAVPLTLLFLVGILSAVPYTRYALAAAVVSQPVTITVIDSTTDKPVSSADVLVDGRSGKTDTKGVVTVKDVKVGNRTLIVNKKYYKTTSQTILIEVRKPRNQQIRITATGRQVPITVINKITGKPLENVSFKASGSEVKSDKQGKAIIVLPADKTELPLSISNNGYNAMDARVRVTEQSVRENNYALVPAGTLYFLSRQSGKLDVVKTDLDGANRQTVIAGTGKEDDRSTVLLASRDWKYLAFHSKRDSGPAKLYLIDTSTDKMTVIDEGNAAFTLVGWNDYDFVYKVQRNTIKYWQANHLAFKSFNAEKKQILTIDQSAGDGDQNAANYQTFGTPYIIDAKLIYTVAWDFYGNYSQRDPAGKSHSLRQASVNSLSKKDIRTWPVAEFSSYFQAVPYGADEIYLSNYSQAAAKEVYYEYEDGQVKDADVDAEKFNTAYPTYLKSPGGLNVLWSEQRDGRQTFFVGNADAGNAKQVAMIEEGQVYGWYGNEYLLASKKGSELYILSTSGSTPFKVADYHKPQLSYRGYGGGYGGL